MNMNQVAIAYVTEDERERIKAMLGLTDAPWVKDTVRADVTVMDRHGGYSQSQNVAELEFCMAMGGQQFELIRYLEGPNWLSDPMRYTITPWIAHIGFHLDENEDWPPLDAGAVLVQEARTTEHSNPDINAVGRRYHYRIFRVGQCYLKFIKRLTIGQAVLGEAKPADSFADVVMNSSGDVIADVERTALAMQTDAEILAEIERRIAEWFEQPGWAEENAGFAKVQEWIAERTALADGIVKTPVQGKAISSDALVFGVGAAELEVVGDETSAGVQPTATEPPAQEA